MKDFFLLSIITLLSFDLLFGQSSSSFAKNTVSKYFRLNCNDAGNAYSARKTGVYSTYVFWEFKDFLWGLEKLSLTEEERITGMEWKGIIKIKSTYFREYRMCSSNPTATDDNFCGYWDEWEKVPTQGLFIRVTKKNGKWKDYEPEGAYWTFIPAGEKTVPSCSTLMNLNDDIEKRKKYRKQ